jgi:hypothetical protein
MAAETDWRFLRLTIVSIVCGENYRGGVILSYPQSKRKDRWGKNAIRLYDGERFLKVVKKANEGMLADERIMLWSLFK